MLTFRDSLRRICPSWLRGGVAGKVMYAIGVHLDVLFVFAEAAIKSRFPSLYADDSLPPIGRERRIRRGRNEPAQTYAVRLGRWLDDHATRGGPYALLAQVHAYYAALPFAVRLVYRSGRAFDKDPTGNVTMLDVVWEPDAHPERWARWWLIYEWPQVIGPPRVIGTPGLLIGGDWVLGSDLTQTEANDIRAIPVEWNAAHAIGRIILNHAGGGDPVEIGVSST
jgi:hypothetical protein